MAEPSTPLCPTPRRPFDTPPTPFSAPVDSSLPATPSRKMSDSFPVDSETTKRRSSSRTRSVLNLTASTLFGIYSPSGYESAREGSSTPWGTGTLTPARPANIDEGRPITLPATAAFSRPQSSAAAPPARFGIKNDLLPFTLRSGLLFFFGIAYGLVIAHLHDNQQLAPVKVENINRSSWQYLMLWGVAGVVLGRLLPLVDIFWEEAWSAHPETVSVPTAKSETSTTAPTGGSRDVSPETDGETGLGPDWNPAVRSIGAFIGIAFAIVRLPRDSSFMNLFPGLTGSSANSHGSRRCRSPSP